MATLSVSEARAQLPEVLDRVAAGEEITITRHGVPVAVVLRPDAVRSRRAEATIEQARGIASMLASARDASLGRGGVSAARADELVRDVHAGRETT